MLGLVVVASMIRGVAYPATSRLVLAGLAVVVLGGALLVGLVASVVIHGLARVPLASRLAVFAGALLAALIGLPLGPVAAVTVAIATVKRFSS